MKKTILGLLVILPLSMLLLFQVQFPATAITLLFNSGDQFISNPNGVWSYGWKNNRNDGFNLYTSYIRDTSKSDHWYNSQIGSDPGVSYNGTGAIIHPAGTTSFQPGKLVLHPGQNGEYSVLRWTAPTSGRFSLWVIFTGVSGYNGSPVTTTDVSVYLNGYQLYLGYINLKTYGNTTSFSKEVFVYSGEKIDFIVGNGNNNYRYDSTEVDVSIYPIQ